MDGVTSSQRGKGFGLANDLNGWLRTYSRTPAASAREIRALAEQNKEQFYFHSFPIMRRFDGSQASGFLAIVLMEKGLLMSLLSEPGLPEQRIGEIVEAILKQDPALDVVLARNVVEIAQQKQQTGGRNPMLRILNQLERLADPKRLAPRLLPLLHNSDPRMRSKAIGIIGRCGKNPNWVARHLTDPDARVRANALEALWGVVDEDSRAILKDALRDSSSRVVGNAFLELYRQGDPTSLAGLIGMASRACRQFRSSAAWAMGESRDVRFRPTLVSLAASDDSGLRRRASQSIAQVDEEAAAVESRPQWRMVALAEQPLELVPDQMNMISEEARANRRLRLALWGEDGRLYPEPIPATRFQISDGGVPVMDYSLAAVPLPERLALAFLLPVKTESSQQFAAGIERAFGWRRSNDLWAAVRFKPPRQWNIRATLIGEIIEIAPPDEIPLAVDPPVFSKEWGDMEDVLDADGSLGAHTNIWCALAESCCAASQAVAEGGEAHLIVFSPGEAPVPTPEQSEHLGATRAGTRIHCICLGPSPPMQDLCRRSGGIYIELPEDASPADAVEWLNLRLVAQYALEYESATRNSTGLIYLNTPDGWAQVQIPFHRASSPFTLF
jgi:HEAT repeat protein